MRANAILLLVTCLLLPAVCRAAPAVAEVSSKPVEPSMWRESWPTFSWTEGVATLSAGVGTLVLMLYGPVEQARWHGGILFDDATRNGLRLESAGARQRARKLGDLPYYAAGMIPLVIDPVLAAWIARDDAKAAANLALVSLEAFSYVGLLSFVSTHVSARERPDSIECRRQRPDGQGCAVDTEAFWSGHTSIAAASAGIVCASHSYMPLWKYPALDVGACALATSGALATGVSRILADRHYATDVIAGSAVGFGIGYLVPVLLHYSPGEPDLNVSFQVSAACSQGCASVSGSF